MLVDGKRALAYIVKIDSITPIEGADNIELAHVGGWNVIVQKQEFSDGDLAVFFEIDSKLPEKEWSEFLRPKKFAVKTYKIGKFKVISQGLLLPLSILPEGACTNLGADMTDILGVTYYVKEDNERKADRKIDPNEKYNRMAARHKNLFEKKPFKMLMKKPWGRKLLFVFFGRNIDKPDMSTVWPNWIKKTAEERCENLIWDFVVGLDTTFVVTEKLDGTSATFFLDATKRKPEFGVCSRNVRQKYVSQEALKEGNKNINVYWEMAYKYNIPNVLKKISEKYNIKRVVLQGEIYGANIQNNLYRLKERRFATFNLIFDGKRLGSVTAKEILDEYDVPFVPIVDKNYAVPEDFEKFKSEADGKSLINKRCIREGFVYRTKDGSFSFKNVSRDYCLKKG